MGGQRHTARHDSRTRHLGRDHDRLARVGRCCTRTRRIHSGERAKGQTGADQHGRAATYRSVHEVTVMGMRGKWATYVRTVPKFVALRLDANQSAFYGILNCFRGSRDRCGAESRVRRESTPTIAVCATNAAARLPHLDGRLDAGSTMPTS
jgi:hypothetical protein